MIRLRQVCYTHPNIKLKFYILNMSVIFSNSVSQHYMESNEKYYKMAHRYQFCSYVLFKMFFGTDR